MDTVFLSEKIMRSGLNWHKKQYETDNIRLGTQIEIGSTQRK